MEMHTKYGPGGDFEPDWCVTSNTISYFWLILFCRIPPSRGPLVHPLPVLNDDFPGMPPGPMGPPPGSVPMDPPQMARPAWRNIQERRPRRQRSRRTEMPEPSLAPPEPVQHPPSWHRWNRKFLFNFLKIEILLTE
jgi:hypothetical protein